MQLLERTFQYSTSAWRQYKTLPRPTRLSFEHAKKVREPIWLRGEYEKVVRYFPHHQVDLNGGSGRKFLYLPPLPDDEHFVAVLLGGCDVDSSKSYFNIEFHTCSDEGQTNAIGFRYEGPGAGAHAYWHLQMNPVLQFSEWLPETIPCVPLLADDPVDVLLTLLLSLYGYHRIAKFIREVNGFPPYLERLGTLASRM